MLHTVDCLLFGEGDFRLLLFCTGKGTLWKTDLPKGDSNDSLNLWIFFSWQSDWSSYSDSTFVLSTYVGSLDNFLRNTSLSLFHSRLTTLTILSVLWELQADRIISLSILCVSIILTPNSPRTSQYKLQQPNSLHLD